MTEMKKYRYFTAIISAFVILAPAVFILSGCNIISSHSGTEESIIEEAKQEETTAETEDDISDNMNREEPAEEAVEEAETEDIEEEDAEAEAVTEQEEMQITLDENAQFCFGYLERDQYDNPFYEGYFDECTINTRSVYFLNQDYDGDGIYDRVYITPIKTRVDEEDYDAYKITIYFGNKTYLECDNVFSMFDNPYIYSMQLPDDTRLIVIQYICETSTSPLYGSSFDIYEKVDGNYIKVDEDRIPVLGIKYRKTENDTIMADINNPDFSCEITQYDVYDGNASKEEFEQSFVYIYTGTDKRLVPATECYLVGIDEKENCFKLRCLLLDKWCHKAVEYDLKYEDGEFIACNPICIDKPYEIPDNISSLSRCITDELY